jgi:hypothetical protein
LRSKKIIDMRAFGTHTLNNSAACPMLAAYASGSWSKHTVAEPQLYSSNMLPTNQ